MRNIFMIKKNHTVLLFFLLNLILHILFIINGYIIMQKSYFRYSHPMYHKYFISIKNNIWNEKICSIIK